VYEFQNDFLRIYKDIRSRGRLPVLCGGTGMYIESVLKGYKLLRVPENTELRAGLAHKSHADLIEQLESFKVPHNVTDLEDRDRLIRAIEIQIYYSRQTVETTSFPQINSILFGIHFEREVIRERITRRLKVRLNMGMLEEVKTLLQQGLKPEQLKFYGLEYKFLTQHVIGEISFDEMFRLLNTAIHQFAKRQMTWFRKMERGGYKIHWIDGDLGMDEKLEAAIAHIKITKFKT